MMRPPIAIALVGILAGCGGGRGVVLVTVDSSGTVAGVSQFRVTVVANGATSKPSVLPIPGAPVDIPPKQTLSLQLGADRSGPITVMLDALGASGNTIASGNANGDIQPSKETDLTITLPGAAVSDMGADMPGAVADMLPAIQWKALDSMTMNDLNAVWGSGPNDVYVAGAMGKILHSLDGTTWASQASNTGAELRALWGNAKEVYAVGASSTIVHTTDGGMTWAPKMYGASVWYGVWGSSPAAVYAVGSSGRISKTVNGGMTWTDLTSGTQASLTAIWGSGDDNIFVVGDGGTILRSTDAGMTWMPESSGTMSYLGGVWGDVGGVYAVGYNANIRYSATGVTWMPQTSNAAGDLNAVWGSDGTDVYVAGALGTIVHSVDHGVTWTPAPVKGGAYFNAIWGSDANDVFAVGRMGVIVRKM